jgi:DNA-binding beta-propeller fold protein YncE
MKSLAGMLDGIRAFMTKGATRRLAPLCCLLAVLAAGLGIRPAMAQLPRGGQRIAMPGSPFAVRTTPDGRWALVSVSQSVSAGAIIGSNGIAVLERTASSYRYVRLVPLEAPPSGLAINRDGTLLVAAASRGVAFIDVQRAVTGAPDAVIGFEALGAGFGTIEVALSADERFIFVANETVGTVSVIDRNAAFHSAFASAFAASAVLGQIPVGLSPVGLAVSRDGAHLYVTNERARPGTPGYDPGACRIQTGPGTTTLAPEGTILVVDTGIAEITPSSSVVSRVLAGCAPVRIRLTAAEDGENGEDHHVEPPGRDDDEVAWVTARGEDHLKAFSAARLLSDPAHALLTSTPVGTAPVGLQPFADGRLIAVANSNRFSGGMPGSVSIIATRQALTLTTFGVGVFPREWGLSPDGRKLFLTEFGSSVLDIFDEDRLLPWTAGSRDEVNNDR